MIHFFLAGFFMYLLARALGAGDFGSLVSGIIFMCAALGFLTACPEKSATVSWIPLIILLLQRLLDHTRLIIALTLAVSIALQFLCG
ncbi:MAG: hypothetical protein NT045_06740, partial [Candidatus Aureabacteria bacterium]|nr:hypothetical protein [Candidatus Auribacterota bacterium]